MIISRLLGKLPMLAASAVAGFSSAISLGLGAVAAAGVIGSLSLLRSR